MKDKTSFWHIDPMYRNMLLDVPELERIIHTIIVPRLKDKDMNEKEVIEIAKKVQRYVNKVCNK